MFTDPFVIKAPTLSAHSAITVSETISLARVQEQGGASLYGPSVVTNGHTLSMRVSHSESNENKPIKTKRVLVRLDFGGFTKSLQPGVAFAYLVIGMPLGGLLDVPSIADGAELTALQMAQMLVGAVAVSSTAATLDETKVPRLSAGES